MMEAAGHALLFCDLHSAVNISHNMKLLSTSPNK